jgi:hypothetical protein
MRPGDEAMATGMIRALLAKYRGDPKLCGELSMVTLDKDEVQNLLLTGEAVVEMEPPEAFPGGRAVSEVWSRFGYVRLTSSHKPVYVSDVVACSYCHKVYTHRSKTQGTSNLRQHRCQRLTSTIYLSHTFSSLDRLLSHPVLNISIWLIFLRKKFPYILFI